MTVRTMRGAAALGAWVALGLSTVGQHLAHPLFHTHPRSVGCAGHGEGVPPRTCGHEAEQIGSVAKGAPGGAAARGLRDCPVCRLLDVTHKFSCEAPPEAVLPSLDGPRSLALLMPPISPYACPPLTHRCRAPPGARP